MTFDANKPSEIKLPSAHEELLGIFLRDTTGKLFTEYRSRLQSDMFQEYQWLFELMLEVEKVEPPTFRAIAVRARDKAELLQVLRGCAGTVARIPELISKLKKQSLAEKLRNLGRRLYTEASDETDADELLRELQQQIYSLQTSEQETVDPERDVEQWYEWLTEIMDDPSKAFGLMTGHTEMDRLTTGFHRTDFVVVGARTSIGKSAFEIDVILRLTKLDINAPCTRSK
ncbi:DnaB-like helicase C-terminal domain-containing protein [Gordoniibacillus kamchatkensis]|uniref:DnaB-like helicase C-terminal domain-containing protein n=1 Tax=Gordoniibacillus kamchatkensis TaxID=1590651 RepID=UPI000696CC46|nr:DnaB-like helicase C-terminal domain-containing protein [Paenibacillus sp. VKM B-2647]